MKGGSTTITTSADPTDPSPAGAGGLDPSESELPSLSPDTRADEVRAEAAAIASDLIHWIAEQRAGMMRRWCQQSISTPNLHVLMALASVGQITMSRLAELRDISLPNATGIVTRMEQRGLVERIHDDQDRRVVVVRLTPAGEDIVEELELVKHRSLRRTLEAMDRQDRHDFARGMRAFFAANRRLAAAGQLDDEGEPELSPVAREALAEADHESEGVATR